MSEPRRRWVHLHIARALDALSDPEGALAGDVAHHAALGGESELAARAYVAAGDRALRLMALADASRLAASGMQHAARLGPEASIRMRVALLGIQVHSNQWLKRSSELEGELRRVARLAEGREMHAEATRCYYLVSFLHNERGDFARAGAVSLEAAEAGRAADVSTRQHQLANTGRCLALIERDVERAHDFLREARSLGEGYGPTRLEMVLGEGLLRAFEGLDADAIPLLEQAVELAADEADPWGQSHALIRLARLALEHGRPRETIERCASLEPLVARQSEGSERAVTDALRGLARLATGEREAASAVEDALGVLRRIDSKAHVAYVLNALAAHDASSGRSDAARQRAREALHAAEIVGHKSECAVARALLATLAIDRNDRTEAEELLDACAKDMAATLSLSGRARAAVIRAFARLGRRPPEERPAG